MRVLYFHQHFTTPAKGGSGTRSYELSRRLLERGHSVVLVCGEVVNFELPSTSTKGISRGIIDGIDVIQIALGYSNKDGIAKRTWTFLRFAYHGIRIALKEKYDLLFATSTPLTAGIPGIVMKWFRRKKFVFEVRDLWPDLPRALGMKNPFLLWGMDVLEWLSYRSANACVGLAPGICEKIGKRTSYKKPIEFVPNGSDLDIFKPGNRAELRLEGICPNDIVAVFTGAHGISNGLDAVLNAAVELKNLKRNDIKLVFIGDGKLKPGLIKRANEEKLCNCKFYNTVPKIELNKIVSNSDIGMMILANIPAFYYCTSPNKFFDYISSGLPILNNYPGWISEMIKDHECGIAVSPNDPVAFAEALIYLADHPEKRKLFGANSRKLAEDEFARQKLADRFVNFLEKINGQSVN